MKNQSKNTSKRVYRAPKLSNLGNVRKLTKGQGKNGKGSHINLPPSRSF